MNEKITKISICVHCGCDRKIVDYHIQSLKPLEQEYEIDWNLRIERFPHAYPSYSKLINDSIVSSKHETMIMINDRCHPTVAEAKKMLQHLETGFACSFMYNVGYMAFSKDLVRKIGFWDERFLNGGWEDVDWVYRLKLANLALYESSESGYDYHWKSPLQNNDRCALSEPHFRNKYKNGNSPVIYKYLPEETYDYDLGPHQGTKFLDSWNYSVLGIAYAGPNRGIPASKRLENYEIREDYK